MLSLFFIILGKETIVTDTNIFLFSSCFSQHPEVRRKDRLSESQRNLGQSSQRLFLPFCFQKYRVPVAITARIMVALVKIKTFFTLLRRVELNGSSNKLLFLCVFISFFHYAPHSAWVGVPSFSTANHCSSSCN